MPVGVALTIGLASIDPGHYGTTGELGGCEPDATAMADLLRSLGYRVDTLLTRSATRARVKAAILLASNDLADGDTFVLHYSGHGSQVPAAHGAVDEGDGLDETWCLYDAMLFDEELWDLWTYFDRGVSVVVISDSCHSGSVTRLIPPRDWSTRPDSRTWSSRALPPWDRDFALRTHRDRYGLFARRRRKVARDVVAAEILATIILVSACLDHETAKDDGGHGVFTRALLDLAANGRFASPRYNYMQLTDDLVSAVAIHDQHPRMTTFAGSVLPLGIAMREPFAIGPGGG